MDGPQFLKKGLVPETVGMMLTGPAGLNDAVAAANEDNIFRFLAKPCPHEVLFKALEAALEQYRQVMAERELVEKTLHGVLNLLTEILS
jgi:DNA-binding NtrC family response regulator